MSMKETDLKLHLGCSNRFISGFTHIDLSDAAHIDYVQDVSDLSCFEDNTASLIYASHVLEYFDELQVIDVLREWHRVLQVGGTLRLAVPDLDALIQVYKESGSPASILGPLYGRMDVGGTTAYHKTIYTYNSLSVLLRATGYKAIRHWNWRETEHAEVDDCSQAYWPHMDKDAGVLISLNIEGDVIK